MTPNENTTPEPAQAASEQDTRRVAEQERELRVQLALARARVAELEERRSGSPSLSREVVRIPTSDPPSFFEDDEGGWDTPAETLPVATRIERQEEPRGPRPTLRLYGEPPLPETYAPFSGMPALPVVATPHALPSVAPVSNPPSGDRLPWEAAPAHPTPAAVAAAPAPTAMPVRAPQRVDLGLESYRNALGLLRDRDFEQSERAFVRFVEVFPRHPQVSRARYWLAELAYIQRRYPQALEAFNRYIERHPSSAKRADAMLRVAFCHRRLGHQSAASEVLQRLQREYPDSDAARLAVRESAR